MPYKPEIHHRKSIRLKGYDYSKAGDYFITICANNREHIFGRISEPGKMILSKKGEFINKIWQEIPNRFPNTELDIYIIMPNHIHGIIKINEENDVGAPLVGALMQKSEQISELEKNAANVPKQKTINGDNIIQRAPIKGAPTTLGEIIGAFKSLCASAIIKEVKQGKLQPFNNSIWQRNFYEHIIRKDNDYENIYNYIQDNPYNWDCDIENELFKKDILEFDREREYKRLEF